MIVLDTNILSELMRPAPSAVVIQWVAAQPRAVLHLAAPSCAEILAGIALMPQGRRRQYLESQADGYFNADFRGNILDFDLAAAEAYADIVASRSAAGRPIGTVDAMIAAIARVHGASIATRDGGFAGCGVPLVDPWQGG